MKIHSIHIKLFILISILFAYVQSTAAQSGDWSNYKASGYESGSGTEADPYVIKTAEQLAYFAAQVTAGNDLTANVELRSSIDLGAHYWVPIGDRGASAVRPANEFAGVFNGNGCTISNMTVDFSSGVNNGLFSQLKEGCIVRNINFENAKLFCTSLTGVTHRMGVVAGATYGTSAVPSIENISIRNSSIKAEKNVVQPHHFLVGGIMGGLFHQTNIKNCYMDVDIDLSLVSYSSTSKAYIAQAVAGVDGGTGNPSLTLKNVYSVGKQTLISQMNYPNVGTMVGWNPNKVLLTECYYKNVPTDKNGNALSLVDASHKNGEQKTEDYSDGFVTLANGNLGDNLQSWKISSSKPKVIAKYISVKQSHEGHTSKTIKVSIDNDDDNDTYTYEWTYERDKTYTANGKSIDIDCYNKTINGSVKVMNGTSLVNEAAFTISPLQYSVDLYADVFYSGGNGSKESPYIISNDMQLAKLARDVNNAGVEGVYKNVYFKLDKDIDLSSALWLPIGSSITSNLHYFMGKFDGNGHAIRNLHMFWKPYAGTWGDWGLFSQLRGASADEAGFCSVSNFILDNVLIEKETGASYSGSGINLGTVAGEAYKYSEISNIIVKNAKITDNDETYTTSGIEYRVGGMVGNINNNDVYRIFNLSTDADIQILKNVNTNKAKAYVGGAFGRFNLVSSYNHAYRIYPTNIYVHGPIIANSGRYVYRGSIASGITSQPSAEQASTWYYANGMDIMNTRDENNGNQKSLDEFASTFVLQNNNFIGEEEVLDKAAWMYGKDSGFYFGKTRIKLERGENDILTAETQTGNIAKEKYFWYVSSDRKTWNKVESTETAPQPCNPFTLAHKTDNQYVYAELADGSSRSNYILVSGINITATIENIDDKSYEVTITHNIPEWTSNDNLVIDYQWVKNGENVGANQATYSPESIQASDKISCHVIVKDKQGIILLDKWVYKTTVVYLCPIGVSVGGHSYEKGTDNVDDKTWGFSPDKPMQTWWGAYKKLADNASWDENVIVLMGESPKQYTDSITKGFPITANYYGNVLALTKERWEAGTKDSPLFKNTTITSTWKNTNYDGTIVIGGGDIGLPLWGDTKFENITFSGKNQGSSYYIIYCQYNNLEMGKGIKMTEFNASPSYGTVDGANTTNLQIFGGLLSDGRFVPLNNAENIEKMEKSMPHGKEGFSMNFKSGYYSVICAGGRQKYTISQEGKQQNGVMGTPNQPVKCTITMDIDRDFNDKNKATYSDYDAGIILAGNHEGAMYADVDIIIRSGHVGRLVNGSLGNKNDFSFVYPVGSNNWIYAPNNSYMGRANILLDPEKSENNKNEEKNKRIIVTELYGGGTGRGFTNSQIINNPFYGLSTVTINGGTFKMLPENNTSEKNYVGIFGAGAGGTNGIGDDKNHTQDDRIPYWNDDNTVMLYGKYDTAKNKLISYRCYNADTKTYTYVDPLNTSTKIIINDGQFGESEKKQIDGIYGGGSGYMSRSLWSDTSGEPNTNGGNIYGLEGKTVATITINGGDFYCKKGIFAGGRGTNYYFTENAYGGSQHQSSYTDLGKTYGNVELNINGGMFHCSVFGGGYGVADAALNGDKSKVATLKNMARVYGKSTVNINGGTFYKNIYGGGDMAVTEYYGKDAATNVTIGDKADIRGSVFGGGNGRKYGAGFDNIDNETLLPDSVGKVIGNTNVTFVGDMQQAPTVYGDIYGGGNLARVEGNTDVNLYAANFAGQIFGGGKGLLYDNGTENEGKVRNSADVLGNTNVSLAKDENENNKDDESKKDETYSINVIWDKVWSESRNDVLIWGSAGTEDLFFKNGKYVNPHNIYGGGNLACRVGNYTKDENGVETLKENTGKATVTVLKGMTPFSLLKTQEWKQSYTDNDNPHFYVFGGGYGKNTSVGSTEVTVNVEGDYGIYDAETDDDTDQLAKDHDNNFGDTDNSLFDGDSSTVAKKSRKARKANKAIAKEKSTIPVFDNTKGIPNFTILGVMGGGYSGIVNGDTKVTVDGQTFLHRVYGGGFGDPESVENNTTGQVKGNTEVYVQGAKTYGDVFGGGAGVAPKTADGIHFTDVARVIGTTKVEVSDDANVYGKVFGGGDMANVGEKTTQDYSIAASSVSTLDENNNGAFLGYEAKDYRSFVNIIGGNVYGEVFGGGKGLTKAKATEYYNVGRINGNTLVHVTDSKPGADFDDADNIKPYVWNRIYGGCAYGTVDGNTLVHIEGGMLGLNIFGGGYGDVKINSDKKENDQTSGASTSMDILQQVLGKKDTEGNGTYANILGNTKVQIDGGSWIWNQIADINGNKLKWTAADEENGKVCDDYIEFRKIAFAMQDASTADNATLMKLKNIIQKISTDKSTKEFFDIKTLSFKKNHNIFGGGNRACYVGTYTNSSADNMLSEAPVNGTGEAEVVINHSPLTDIPDSKGNLISLLDNTTLQGFCWVLANSNTAHPQFSVFGAGYGANTKVGNAYVYMQPGARSNTEGTDAIAIDGKKMRYLNQHTDGERYRTFVNRLADDFLKISKDDKKLYYGSADGTDNDPKTYQRYRTSRMAWELGVPNSTFFEIHGGGFSGYVVGNTYVETDCQLTCRNIYGAGLGHVPYGDIIEGTKYDFGSIGGNSKVFVKSGYVARNVYGGGAGIESVRVSAQSIVDFEAKSGEIVDFPDMARVNKKAEVNVYGEDIESTNSIIDRTQIFGSVYGGGDVANVGTEDMKAEAQQIGHEAYFTPQNYTSLVNIRGGAIFSQIFAGGNGRKASQCNDYTKLGSIYGNSCIVIDRPAPGMTYPYYDEEKGEWKNPSDGNMQHPGTGVNEKIIPHIFNRIYGGCENGTIYGNTIISINDGYLGHNIFGGGWGSCDTLTVDNTEVVETTSADVTGNTNMLIVGGQVLLTSYWNPDKRFWEPSTIIGDKIYSPQYNPSARKFHINHNIYGGGNAACVVGEKDSDGKTVENSGNTYLTMVRGLLYDTTEVLSGQTNDKKFFERDEWKEVYEKVGSPHFGIFGGGYGENTTILADTHVNVQMQGHGSIKDFGDLEKGNEYKHFLSGYSVMDIVGGGYAGKVVGNTHILGGGGVFCRRMFGGGFYNSVSSTNVEVKAIDCHDIFGGGLMGDVEKNTSVTIGYQKDETPENGFSNKDIFIHGDVYGGNDVSGYVNVVLDTQGYFADNEGNGTAINIYGGKIDGNVYGAGNGDYLYALDQKGHTQVTVNEHYPLNPKDPNSETEPLVYTVPMRETMPSYKAASDAAKIVNINSWRPLTNKVVINIKGNSESDRVVIKGEVYGGGNSATVQKVQKVQKRNVKASANEGFIRFNIGSHVNIKSMFMGCNGDALFTTSEDNNFMNKFQKLNGDIDDYSKELNLGDTIDWKNDPSNKGISTLYLSTKNDDRPTVYPHLLDLYFQPVETDIQASLTWATDLSDCTIGTFCCGGNRGNMNVYPDADGNAFEYTFPEGLTIIDKIVGGCNNANYDYKGKVSHEGGYLLGLAHSVKPFIKLNIKNKFNPYNKNGAYYGGNVYGGCYKTGTVRGDISINLVSDMLDGKSKEMLEKSNELISTTPEYSALNVYGAGYGMESYVYGNTNISVADGIICDVPSTSDDGVFNHSGTSANFVYGGGQQGNVIGMTNVDIYNGHIFKAVTGGSYSGYVWGSTQVKVGYPKYYKVHPDNYQSGRYILARADKNNQYIDREGKTKDGALRTDLASETIKQSINLITDDIISQAVYEDIVAKYDSISNREIDITNEKSKYFQEIPAATPSVGWNNINIQIGEAVYGGGYSVGQGTSVLANATTVLKFTPKYNIDNAFTTNDKHIEELKNLPGGTTAGFGGNTTVLVGDRTTSSEASSSDASTDRDHITISHQNMKVVTLADGTDLYGYYYKDKSNNYRYISVQDTYFYGKGHTHPDEQNVYDDNFYQYDSEGGIFGDGHQSYAQGFRSADLTGYGFAGSTVTSSKIINTFQRLDILRLEDNCFNVLGARDYATNATNKTPYSIARVGEIQMHAVNVEYDTDGKLQKKNIKRARNYMGLANNIHYVGAITSDVVFNNEMWRDSTGLVPTSGAFVGKTYQQVKQYYIDDYFKGTNNPDKKGIVSFFQMRNDGTSKNMIGIASGYALKIQGVQETYDTNHKVEDNIYYGPVYGVIEMNLIDVRPDEGGGYVYADNVHKRSNDSKSDFLETTGNFVFPYTAKEGHFIVDDCFPTGYVNLKTDDPDTKEDVHYWYVTGFNYYYNAHITGYTYKDHLTFNSDNSDGLTVLSGLIAGQEVEVFNWKMRSGHKNNKDEYSCDLENRNYSDDAKDIDNNPVKGHYSLYLGAAKENTYSDPVKVKDKNERGFAVKLPMNEDNTGSITYINKTLPSSLVDDAKITFQLRDSVNNTTSDYFAKHLAEKCQATLVLKAPALKKVKNEDGTEIVEQIISNIGASVFYTKDGNDYVPVESGHNNHLQEGITYYIKNGIAEEFTPVDPNEIYLRDDKEESGYKRVKITDVDVDEPVYYCAVPRYYTYTVYLTIEYVLGPTIEGNITIENCALPGEMIRIKKNEVSIKGDQSFSANGYYWRIGRCKKDDKGKLSFVDDTDWQVGNVAEGYDSYKQGEKEGFGVFKDCFYDKTEDYLDIPAYYYLNGYGVQLGITMNGLDKIFPVDMQPSDTLVVHNYHKMDPGQTGVHLQLEKAIARAHTEKDFAEPRIYISDQKDLTAFINFVDTIGTGKDGGYVKDDKEYVKLGAKKTGDIWEPALYEVPRYGANAQFIIQNDMNIATDYDGTSHTDFAGTAHGNGHVISGLKSGRCLFNSISGNVYNLGLTSGKISNMQSVDGKIKNYHCCYEYSPVTIGNTSIPVVYRMDGTLNTDYTAADFRSGRVAYDLNEYYLRARYSNNKTNKEDMTALKYLYDYYENGDYQYAHRSDNITGRVTGITYLRIGKDSDLPNYGQAATRHDQSHKIDKARQVSSSDGVSTPVVYEPLFNDNHEEGAKEEMNDFLFWGQSLQSTPANTPTTIGYQQYKDNVYAHQLNYMTNRVYRTAGYYGNTKLDAFHYNAYNYGGSNMDTYVHDTKTTAIDFTCQNDLSRAVGMTENTNRANAIFYPPVDDNAMVFHGLNVKEGVTQNLLVYTAGNSSDDDNDTEAYDIAYKTLAYNEKTKEAIISGHHIVEDEENNFSTTLLHLVERASDDNNSEGETCENNDFCAPIAFSVTNRAWYTRKPLNYAEDKTGAWEGICLPFTVNKAETSLNGEITHFYGTPGEGEIADPVTNIHTLHHEYWLRGLVDVKTESGKATATYQRPGAAGSTADGTSITNGGSPLFAPVDKDGKSLCEAVSYVFDNPFFINNYGDRLYNKTDNPYYADSHTYSDYLLQVANVPYIVRFPGEQYYEFDLSSAFYNNITAKKVAAQTVTFNAYGPENENAGKYGTGEINIPVTSAKDMATTTDNGFSHHGVYVATNVASQEIYGMNADGTAFDDASTLSTVMPFRTYMTMAASRAKTRSAVPSVINIAEPAGIDKISPDLDSNDEDSDNANSFSVRPIGNHRVSIESTQAMLLDVYTAAGQLFRKLDIQPGTATYSGFPSGLYIFGKTKVAVE